MAAAIAFTASAEDVKLTDYKAGEINLDAGYALSTETFGDYTGHTYLGGNYLLTKNAGLHLGAIAADEFHGTFVEQVEFGLMGRLPFKSLALDFGIGASFGLDRDDWEVYAEAGPRWRLSMFNITRNVDVFAKIRGSRPIKSADGERVTLIAGAGLHF